MLLSTSGWIILQRVKCNDYRLENLWLSLDMNLDVMLLEIKRYKACLRLLFSESIGVYGIHAVRSDTNDWLKVGRDGERD